MIGMRRQNLNLYLSDLVALKLVGHPSRGQYYYIFSYFDEFVQHINDPMSGAYVGSLSGDGSWRGLVKSDFMS